jgi:tetratricopeptide (TPR) repeat protein
MALVNVAFELARRKKNVLLVDFDLEAPGITTYPPFKNASDCKGIVDYVTRYQETLHAPDVREYIVRASTQQTTEHELPVWLMPAGLRDPEYASKLASIDWQRLYEHRAGFLMFEDMKQQWAQFEPKFDYVFVDSRTGHTDVGGICTRQLPDAVALLFLPNEQNVSGLRQVVSDIREENTLLDKGIKLLFCPSNVPSLDDELDILKNQMESAERDLQFGSPTTVIHRYDSLALLDQTVFVQDRPKTRLAEEYRTLATAIARLNLEDREGALAALEEIRRETRTGPSKGRPTEGDVAKGTPAFLADVTTRIEQIRRFHPNDGRVAWLLASVSDMLGDLSGEFEALGVAIQQNYRSNDARYRRALCLVRLQKHPEAIADLKAVLNSEESNAVNVRAAIELLRAVDPKWTEIIQVSMIRRLALDDQLAIAGILASDKRGLPFAAEIAAGVAKAAPAGTIQETAKNELALSLIGSGHFQDALTAISPSREALLASQNMSALFNYAMAEWGETGKPPTDLFERVVELQPAVRRVESYGANFSQCLSLAYFLVGDREEAKKYLERAHEALGPGEVFSCWRYLRVSSDEMKRDLRALDKMISGEKIVPTFLPLRATFH